MSEMSLSFYLYKRDNKLIFYIRNRFGYGFSVSTYIPITRPASVFRNRGKPKFIPKLSQSGENPSI